MQFWIIFIVFFVLRLFQLTILPSFTDESIYLDWGWREIHYGVPFHSLYDAKQPLVMWLFGLSETIFSDPLFAGRLISVIFGLVTLIGLYKLTLYFINKQVAILATICYLLTPILLFFDRQALMESAVSAIGVWLTYVLIKFINTPNLKHALYFALLIAAGCWTKSSSLLYIIPSLIIYIYHAFTHPPRFYRLTLLVISLSFTIVFLLPLFFQPLFWSTLGSNSRYGLTISEIFKFPFPLWQQNLLTNLEIAFYQLNPLIFLLIPTGIYLTIIQKPPHYRSLIFLIFFPIILETLITRNPTPRYLASFLPLLLIPISLTLSRLSKLIIVFVFIIPTFISLLLIYSPPKYFTFLSRFSKQSMSESYLCCQSYSYPTRMAINYLQTLPTPFVVSAYLNVGNPPSALFAYFRRHPDISASYLDSVLFGDQLVAIDCLTSPIPVYFLAVKDQTVGLAKYLQPITKFTNPYGSQDYLTLYTLNTNCSGTTFPLSLIPHP